MTDITGSGVAEGEIAYWKIGVDIAGTFVDFCALETYSGRMASLKIWTTPDDPGAELMTGLSLDDHPVKRRVTRPLYQRRLAVLHQDRIFRRMQERKGARGVEMAFEEVRVRFPSMPRSLLPASEAVK
jgi:hypothetical protein